MDCYRTEEFSEINRVGPGGSRGHNSGRSHQSKVGQKQDDGTERFQIVEKNPTKFRIEASELAVRKGFIESTKDEVRMMKERLANQSRGNLERLAGGGTVGSPSHHLTAGPSKYSRLPSTADSPHR